MFGVQIRQIDPRDSYKSARTGPAWRCVKTFPEWNSEVRAFAMKTMQELGFAPFSDVCELVDELRPGFSSDPFENVFTEDNGNQIRVVPMAS